MKSWLLLLLIHSLRIQLGNHITRVTAPAKRIDASTTRITQPLLRVASRIRNYREFGSECRGWYTWTPTLFAATSFVVVSDLLFLRRRLFFWSPYYSRSSNICLTRRTYATLYTYMRNGSSREASFILAPVFFILPLLSNNFSKQRNYSKGISQVNRLTIPSVEYVSRPEHTYINLKNLSLFCRKNRRLEYRLNFLIYILTQAGVLYGKEHQPFSIPLSSGDVAFRIKFVVRRDNACTWNSVDLWKTRWDVDFF